MKKQTGYYSNLPIRSYNAIWNFINTIRSKGKTWSFCLLALRQAQKHGKKTLFIRRFKAEAKEARGKLFNEKFRKTYGLTEENFKWLGYTAYVKVNKKWTECAQLVYLSQANSIRGARDSNTYFIVFDEYTTTPERYKRYHGNEVEDLIDIVVSKKGEHEIKVFFLGNKESAINPYFAYFGIPNEKEKYEGIHSYNYGTVAVEYSNTEPEEISADKFNQRFLASLKNTRYGNYLKGATKRAISCEKLPQAAKLAYQFDFIGGVSVYQYDGRLYVKQGVNKDIFIFVNTPKKYRRQRVLQPRDSGLLTPLIEAYKMGYLAYTSDIAGELFTPILSLFNLK